MSQFGGLGARLFEASGCPGAAEFLASIWQREAQHLAAVTGDLTRIATRDLLFNLATESHVESRLVQATDSGHWRMRQGPFSMRELAALPERGWTLLVQDVDKHLEAGSEFLEAFDFVPRWRLDDLMVSYAAPGGSVGPHVDSYDVFLFQALGRRRWELSRQSVNAPSCQECELKVLSSFVPEQSYVLSPGDCLYLPAEIGHHGVALEPCMTFSVGFRTVTVPELLGGALLNELSVEWFEQATQVEARDRYMDALALPPPNPGEVAQETLQRYRALVRAALEVRAERLDRLTDVALVKYLTEPKESQLVEPPDTAPSPEELRAHLAQGGSLRQHPASRWLFLSGVGGAILIGVDGETTSLQATDRRFAELMCDRRQVSGAELLAQLGEPQRLELVLAWLASGQLLISQDA